MTILATKAVDHSPARHPEDTLGAIRSALSNLRFGAIQLTVHEGRLVQMDITEKHRISA